MPKRAIMNVECTQNNHYQMRIPMFDASNGITGAPALDLLGPPRTYEGGVQPGWKSDEFWPFQVTLLHTSSVLHEIVLDLTDVQTDEMPQDCIWALTDTTGGLAFTFIGGAFTVHRKVGS